MIGVNSPAGSLPRAFDSHQLEDSTERDLDAFNGSLHQTMAGLRHLRKDGAPLRIKAQGAAVVTTYEGHLDDIQTALTSAITELNAIRALAEA